MRPEPKKRIDTNPPQAGLNDAFAKLNLDPKNLPPGPAAVPVPEAPQAIWKMGRVVLRKETARRGGKTVIVVDDFASHLPVSVIEKIGKKLRPTELLVFGNPQGGTPLMECAQTAGIDLPLKALVWEDASGKVWLGYNDPGFLAARHGVAQCPVVENLKKALAGFVQEAVSR